MLGVVLQDRGRATTLTLTSPEVVAAVLATTGFLVLTALLGLAVGTLLRSTAGAVVVLTVVVLTGVLFLLPVLVQLVPVLSDAVGPRLPTQAGSAVLVVGDRSGYLPPVAGQLPIVGYTALALAAATARRRRSDA